MPRLWSDSIAAHRLEVVEAVLDATGRLVAEQGPLSVTMSQIAEAAGIARATLYKYFPSLEAVLTAWHRRQVGAHLDELEAVRARHGSGGEALEALLATYGRIVRENPPGRVPVLHADEHVARARAHLLELVTGAVDDGVRGGLLRDDVPARELAAFCVHAMAGAAELPTAAAVKRLLRLTLEAVRRRAGTRRGRTSTS
ncbi:TetR/AcrR family transcriptional regulator [Miltoncostaea marina]|uniref:TetR/AcrR family transcriptional regulator n=1 Tax=Miltoncostaea marina TaxID=2843215 RepID=UPI001C3CFDD5|nr:TetR/AcrR family transcriptional regulator [Miltoncostaea marina]